MKRHTQEEFITLAKQVWGDKFDLSKAEYKNRNTKVAVICREHGVFYITPNNLLCGHGCPKCRNAGISKRTRHNLEQFIANARKKHGDYYDYSRVNYVTNKIPVEIICPVHGSFFQRPDNHVHGAGCFKCKKGKVLDQESFISEATKRHSGRYDYSKAIYKGTETPVEIICPKHGSFWQRPHSHLGGRGCLKCKAEKTGLRSKDSAETFISKARAVHGDKYDYSKVVYSTSMEKVEIICPKHGSFLQKANAHVRGAGCPQCHNSAGEDEVSAFLRHNNIKYIVEKTFPGCKNKRLLRYDFYLPCSHTCIEYQGAQHYVATAPFGGQEMFEYRCQNDQIKRDYCKAHGIRLIEIKYTENVENRLKKELL